MNPLNPNGIGFEVDVPQLLSNEAFVMCFNLNRPRPPSFLGKQTVLQATKADLLFRISPVHRKVWQMLTICVITSSGMEKMLSQSAPCHKEPIGSTQPSQHN
jgi:hypothetical protein